MMNIFKIVTTVANDIKTYRIEWFCATFTILIIGYIFGVTPSSVWFYGLLLMIVSLYGYIEQGWKNIWKESNSYHLPESGKDLKTFIGEFVVILFHKAPLVLGILIFSVGLLFLLLNKI